MGQRLRIFVSSPGDVTAAREIAALTIERLAQDYARFFAIEPYLWEFETMVASGHFQDSIEPPSAFDVVVLIVWSRLGTPLPERTAVREYRGIDGRTPVTGTEWEFEEALQAARSRGVPDLLVYRSRQPAAFATHDPVRLEEQLRQLKGLNAFWERHFANHGVFLAAHTLFGSDIEFAAALETHLRKLIERRISALGGAGAGNAAWSHAPFRGLESYEFEHAPIFFGQDEALAKAMLQLTSNAAAGSPFLLVLGASGSGKSSLVKAGMLPKLFVPRRVPGIAVVRRVVFRPSDAREDEDLFAALARRLTAAPGPQEGLPELLGPEQSTQSLAAQLRHSAAHPAYPFELALGRIKAAARSEGRMLESESARVVLVVDQLEELFTIERIAVEERRAFIDLLSGLVRSRVVWVIATMRKDFWHRADTTPELVRLAEGGGRLELLPPGPAQLSQMIRRPAEAAGVHFEVHGTTNVPLNEVIAEEVDREPGALPLLSYLLDQLYRQDVTDAHTVTLTYATYEALGRLEGAIATKAESVLGNCSAEDRAALGSVLFSLVEMSVADAQIERAVARRVPLATFPPGSSARRLVDALLDRDARLLVSDAEKEGHPTVRVAHEALISRWMTAREFVQGNVEALKIRRRIEERYTLWRRQNTAAQSAGSADGASRRRYFGREPGLLSDIDLVDGRRLLKEHRADTEPHLVEYIERSVADERRIRTRSARLLAAVAGIVTILAVVASVAGMMALKRQHEAEYQTAQALQSEARLLTEAAARHLKDSEVPEAEGIILEVLTNPAFARRHPPGAINVFQESRAADSQVAVLSGHTDLVQAARYSADGSRIVTASQDGTARIWDAVTGTQLSTLTGHTDGLLSAAFAPDGRHLVTTAVDNTVRIWDASSGRQIGALTGHLGAVQSAEYSPDGTRIVTAGHDGTARIWDATSAAALLVLRGHGDRVLAARFSPDGERVVTTSQDKTARIWDSHTGASLLTLKGHEQDLPMASWAPDGKTLVTASWDKTARIWDARTGSTLAILSGHTDTVTSAAYSPDGTRIATASTDKTVRVWDAHTGSLVTRLTGHTGPVYAVTYAPDGAHLLTASWDGTARIWSARPERQLAVIAGHARTVFSAAYSSDGTKIVTASQDRTVKVWDASSVAPELTLAGHTQSVGAARFSPDGTRIVSGSNDGTARIWDAGSGAMLASLKGGDGSVPSAVYSPDGMRIATANQYRTGRIWDARTGASLATLAGHAASVGSIAFSPDGTRLVTASDDKTARIWDAGSATQLLVLAGHAAAVYSAAFSNDGLRVVTASADNTARIWNARTGASLVVLDGHGNAVESANFSPDGNFVVTASDDRTARIWDAHTGDQLEILRGHDDTVESARYSPDAKRIVTASDDATARIWDARAPQGLDAQILWALAAQIESLSPIDRAHLGLPEQSLTRTDRPAGSACDRDAGSFDDPDRAAPGLLQGAINADVALRECTADTRVPGHPAREDYELGRAMLANHDAPGARRQFELAVSRGYRSARIDLAEMLADTAHGMYDRAGAVGLYEKAGADGVAIAYFKLGQLYETGINPPPDPTRAWSWYRNGADRGEPHALARIARQEEERALAAADRKARDEMLLHAFALYAAAAEKARSAEWPDAAWNHWRFRRATLARLLAHDGLMDRVAQAYSTVGADPQARTATLWENPGARIQR